MASSDLTTLAAVKESAYGVIPATPGFKYIRYTGESIKANITNTKTAEIRPDRVESDLVQTGESVDGGFNFELTFGTFDDYIAGAFASTWGAPVSGASTIKNGVTKQPFAFQKHFTDISVPEFHTFNGCCIESMDLKFDIGKIVTGSFTVMGAKISQAESAPTGATYAASNTNVPMNAVTDLGNFSIDGVPYTGCINSLGLTMKNNTRAIQCLGSIGAKDMKLGTLEVTGDMNLYFNDGSIFDKFVEGTEFAFSFDITDEDGNKYSFSIPRAKYESGEALAGGRNSDVMATMKWRALYDVTSNSVISLTSTPHA